MDETFARIQAPVAEHLKGFNAYFDSLIDLPKGALGLALRYALSTRGKQLRPLVVFLSAGAAGGVGEVTRVAAAMVELVHNASLLHDDVVDQAELRRGLPAVYKLWRAKGAVLVGDYMLGLGLQLAVQSGCYELLAHMNRAVQQMSQSELEQLRRAKMRRDDEAGYYEVIRGKTAALLSVSAASGATSVQAPAHAVEALSVYGENLGMAFQIRDDILDFSRHSILGKRAGNDLREGKRTLPVFYAMQGLSGQEARRCARLIVRAQYDEAALDEAIDFVVNSGALERAGERVSHYTRLAVEALAALPQSECVDSLSLLADYLVSRNK